MPRSDGASSWMPDCSHWTISNSSRSSVPVARLSLNALRRYWHPAKDIITSRMGPPLLLSVHLRLPPPYWSHRSWCHRVAPAKVPSPLCALCGLVPEDLFHFVVGCPLKARYWRDVVSLLSLQDLLPNTMSIWQALTSFCSQDSSMLDEEVLVALGTAYSTLWKYHWRCVIDTEPWIASACLNMVRQDHGLLLSSLSSLASVQAGTLTLPLPNL
ncbi:hypothetical protein BD408DRAFT_435042 [Parasitella parasitica]|nr:hypothetical protein BD408DRAFT_435042 [Parasitella parasitica]